MGRGQKDWSNGFNCLWSEDIMAFTQLNLMEIKRPNIDSNSTGGKGLTRKKNSARISEGCSCPKEQLHDLSSFRFPCSGPPEQVQGHQTPNQGCNSVKKVIPSRGACLAKLRPIRKQGLCCLINSTVRKLNYHVL